MKLQLITVCLVLSLVSSSMQFSLFKTMGSMFGIRDTSIEMPNYSVLQKMPGNIEIREYEPTKWVSSTMEGQVKSMKSKKSSTFMKLFRYISKLNTRKSNYN